jgi:CDP-glucose 4,6-dehydratase
VRYLITGHTGFKGSWLALWLASEGHEVAGLALDPLPGGLFERARIAELLTVDLRQDIRDAARVREAMARVDPDVVIHLAAQPLVREGYRDPHGTFTTNVLGTLNVLSALEASARVRAVLVVTTDKVYAGEAPPHGFDEGQPLGGLDPYAASKAMADLLAQSWLASVAGPALAIARAGNVVGGGDVCPERLVPDLLRAHAAGERPVLRYPEAVRPWQHVLDCLHGYRMVVDALLAGVAEARRAWNFGPEPQDVLTVGQVADLVATALGAAPGFDVVPSELRESSRLVLDASAAGRVLGWRNRLPAAAAIAWAVDFERLDGDARELALQQLREFTASASASVPAR